VPPPAAFSVPPADNSRDIHTHTTSRPRSGTSPLSRSRSAHHARQPRTTHHGAAPAAATTLGGGVYTNTSDAADRLFEYAEGGEGDVQEHQQKPRRPFQPGAPRGVVVDDVRGGGHHRRLGRGADGGLGHTSGGASTVAATMATYSFHSESGRMAYEELEARNASSRGASSPQLSRRQPRRAPPSTTLGGGEPFRHAGVSGVSVSSSVFALEEDDDEDDERVDDGGVGGGVGGGYRGASSTLSASPRVKHPALHDLLLDRRLEVCYVRVCVCCVLCVSALAFACALSLCIGHHHHHHHHHYPSLYPPFVVRFHAPTTMNSSCWLLLLGLHSPRRRTGATVCNSPRPLTAGVLPSNNKLGAAMCGLQRVRHACGCCCDVPPHVRCNASSAGGGRLSRTHVLQKHRSSRCMYVTLLGVEWCVCVCVSARDMRHC